MKQEYKKAIGILPLVCAALLSMTACADKGALKPNSEPDIRWLNLIDEGERSTQKRHYLGWLRAERCYEQAEQIKPTAELRKKRAVNLGLLILRMLDLQIPCQQEQERFMALEEALQSPIELCLRRIIYRNYRLIQAAFVSSDDSAGRVAEQVQRGYERFSQEKPIAVAAFAADWEIFVYYEYGNFFDTFVDMQTLRSRQKRLQALMEEKYPLSPLLLYLKMQDLSDFSQFFELDEEYIEPRYYQAQQLLSTNRKAAAEKQFRYVLDRTADLPGIQRSLGLINLSYENYAKAMEHYQRVLMRLPYDYEALFGMGAAQLYSQLYEDSLTTFTTIIDRQLLYQGQAHYYRAVNQYHLQRYDEALSELAAAKEQLEESPDVWELEGIIHYYGDRFEPARLSFERCRSLSDRQKSPRSVADYYLGLVAYKQKRYGQAFADFERSMRCDLAQIGRLQADLDAEDEDDEQKREYGLKRKRLERSLLESRERFETIKPLLAMCPQKKTRRLLEGLVLDLAAIPQAGR